MAYWTAELPLVSLEAIQQQIRQSTNHHFMLVACEGNTVIGTLTFAQSDKPRLCHVGRISQVVVHQTYRGRGALLHERGVAGRRGMVNFS
ncbi:MAG: GNAT family N-acetyltransferase, partial [Synechococcales cyanobacterium T60_A2020_003]|nr:GNAT family N-acetyltransferase [Synechococcales cyanobacterium T60_A2020_003]